LGLLVKRVRRTEFLVYTLLAADLVSTSMLVYLTGGSESGFVFMYLWTIIAAAVTHGTSAAAVAFTSMVLYGAISWANWAQLLPWVEGAASSATLPMHTLLRSLSINWVAFLGTGVLAGRLARELYSAREKIASQ